MYVLPLYVAASVPHPHAIYIPEYFVEPLAGCLRGPSRLCCWRASSARLGQTELSHIMLSQHRAVSPAPISSKDDRLTPHMAYTCAESSINRLWETDVAPKRMRLSPGRDDFFRGFAIHLPCLERKQTMNFLSNLMHLRGCWSWVPDKAGRFNHHPIQMQIHTHAHIIHQT